VSSATFDGEAVVCDEAQLSFFAEDHQHESDLSTRALNEPGGILA